MNCWRSIPIKSINIPPRYRPATNTRYQSMNALRKTILQVRQYVVRVSGYKYLGGYASPNYHISSTCAAVSVDDGSY